MLSLRSGTGKNRLFAVVSGCVILKRARNQTEKRMGLAALILGCGDAFHLVPRMLNYFVSADFTAALGLGKLVPSITMTLFYLLLFYIWLGYYHEAKNQRAARFVWVCTVLRVVLCLFPQNGWLQNSSDMTWGIIRNVPFVMLGAAVCILYFRKRAERRRFKPLWVLYPRRGWSRRGAHTRNADAAENGLLCVSCLQLSAGGRQRPGSMKVSGKSIEISPHAPSVFVKLQENQFSC